MNGGLFDVLMIACYVLWCDGGFGRSFSGHIVQLSTHSEYSSGKLLAVGPVIPNQKGLITLSDDKRCDLHHRNRALESS